MLATAFRDEQFGGGQGHAVGASGDNRDFSVELCHG
jgi:hypothetical protein